LESGRNDAEIVDSLE